MKKLILISTLSLFCLTLFAQDKTLSSVTETQSLSKKTVSLLASNKITEGFNTIVPYWPIPENEVEDIQTKTIKYFNLFDKNYGEPIGIIKVKQESIKDIALRETFLIRYNISAVRLIFTYYKNDKGWILNAFAWDNEFDEEFITE